MKYINVVIDHNSRHTDTYYTYAAPDDITVGDIVEVSFNRGNKPKTAYVFEEGVTPDCEVSKIKAITGKNSDISLNPEMVKTCIWMKRRYGIKYLDAVKCFVPNGNPAKGRGGRETGHQKADRGAADSGGYHQLRGQRRKTGKFSHSRGHRKWQDGSLYAGHRRGSCGE